MVGKFTREKRFRGYKGFKNTMKVLILEDDPNRIVIFKKNLIGCFVVDTDMANSAIALLDTQDWDVLFLDHDLGNQVYVNPEEENTGSEVTRWLVKNPDKKPKLIILHSMNGPATVGMKSMLRDSVILTFGNPHIVTEQLKNPEVHSDLAKLAEIQNNRLFN